MGASISLDFITHKFSASAAPTLKDIENRIEPGELVAVIEEYIAHHNTNQKPFI